MIHGINAKYTEENVVHQTCLYGPKSYHQNALTAQNQANDNLSRLSSCCQKTQEQICSLSPSNYTLIWFHVVPQDYNTRDYTEHIDAL